MGSASRRPNRSNLLPFIMAAMATPPAAAAVHVAVLSAFLLLSSLGVSATGGSAAPSGRIASSPFPTLHQRMSLRAHQAQQQQPPRGRCDPMTPPEFTGSVPTPLECAPLCPRHNPRSPPPVAEAVGYSLGADTLAGPPAWHAIRYFGFDLGDQPVTTNSSNGYLAAVAAASDRCDARWQHAAAWREPGTGDRTLRVPCTAPEE